MEMACEDIIRLLEGSFDFVLILDESEHIVHANQAVCREASAEKNGIIGCSLNTIASGRMQDRWKVRIDGFRKAMADAREGKRSRVVFRSSGSADCSYSVSCGHAQTERGSLFLFHGNRGSNREPYAEWEKDQRIKELACLYAVADWIDVSASIKEFFTALPKYLSAGFHFPEHAGVFSNYQGVEYGRRPMGDHRISTALEVGKHVRGHIIVGYDADGCTFLPEEQKMLDEIGRMLELALERKELRERLASKQAEEKEYARHLHELEQEIESREKDLNTQREKLGMVNSYLDRLSRDWEESRMRFETMFKAIPDKVAMIDRNRTIVMTNWENVASGEKCYRSFFDADAPCVDCRLMRIVKEKTPITMEIRHQDDYFEVHALPIFNQGQEVEGIFEFYKDVTRQKSYEQQLLQADKLASLGQLVSGIGHEINNPNQFIGGNVRVIKQALSDMLPIIDDYYREHPELEIARLKYEFFRSHIMTLVADMAHGSERIKGIVDGLKRFARKDEGLLTDIVDVNACADASARLAYNQVRKNCEINLDLACNLPTFSGNAQKIEQVLINLIINASQAMPEGRHGLIVIRTRSEGGNVVIEVKDNGKGMSESTTKNIFDPFFTTRRAQGGTGLGLSIAYRIIEEHRGTISVSSKIDVGTAFSISIPVRHRKNAAQAGGPQDQKQSAP